MREHTEQPESIYILQLQHGDKKSFETLFDQYYIPLVDYAYRLLHGMRPKILFKTYSFNYGISTLT